jgi:hypothetical protein
MTIEMDVEDYIELLEARRQYVESNYGWNKMPDCLWNYLMETIRECGIAKEHSAPKDFVDNAIVNGDYGSFDEYKNTNETDDEFYQRIYASASYINREERIVCFQI